MLAPALGTLSMCGRYAITLPPEAIRAWFRYPEQPNFPPRYNIAPTQPIPIVTRDDLAIGATERHFRLVRWGLVPGFVKDWSSWPLIINARAEEIGGKASFRAAMIRRRCLVIADSWYEWRRTGKGKAGTPFLFRRRDRHPIAFAGLHERWMGPDGSEMETACIITTAANGEASAVHPRMPVLIERDDEERWLDVEAVSPEQAASLLRPAASATLDVFPISPAVNKVANDNAAIQEAIEEQQPRSSSDEPRQGSLF